VTIGRATLALSASDDVNPEARAAIRKALGPLLLQLRHELGLASDSLDGIDPEYALSLFVDIIHDLQPSLRSLDAALAAARHLRVAA
jgi:hypothetical protein